MELIRGVEDRYEADRKHYESEAIVKEWLQCYEIEKERQFIRCIDRFIPSDQVDLLEVGCGTGLHAFLWSERNKTVTASDFSTKFRDHILRTYRFPFIWMDVLNWTLDQQYDICFCMGVATILLDEPRRFRTFETLARLVRPGASLVLVTTANRWPFCAVSPGAPCHCLDDRDMQTLRKLGFRIERVFYWSSTPKCLWRMAGLRCFGRGLEELGFRLGIGARKIVVCRLKG